MSVDYPLNCDICGFDNEVTSWNRYGTVICKQCGQRYEYDESMSIVLTDEQMALLAANYKRNEELRIRTAQPITLRTSGSVVNNLRVYDHYENVLQSTACFEVRQDGTVWKDDKEITNDDVALLECFRQWVKLVSRIEIKVKDA